ncbi:Cell death protein 3 [Chionoecetes opilio]|uniref:Cell death protein 3 n=1 Tax=Chionoecetes opilio TaxID=41210 RepID=A0A8J5CSC4_CHIOP|nr:Cell death protein 3 [Chionoecetes opilio]
MFAHKFIEMIQRALDTGVIKEHQEPGNPRSYLCVVCDKTLPEPKPHLKGKDHINNFVWDILKRPSPSKQSLDALGLPDVPDTPGTPEAAPSQPSAPCQYRTLNAFEGWPPTNLIFANTPYFVCLQQLGSDMGASALHHDWVDKPGCDPEVERALQTGVVVRCPDDKSFKCQSCEKEVNGITPLLQHLKSKKHLKTSFRPPLQWLSHLQVDWSWTFPWTVVPASQPHTHDDVVYRNHSTPRGLVLIFNFLFTGHPQHQRYGATRDSFNLTTLFTRMGYKVELHEDLTKTEMKTALQTTQNSRTLYEVDSLIVFVLSHGESDSNFCTNTRNLNEGCMSVDEVRYYFTDTHCPALKDKPKLFFLNFCRGKLTESQILFDGMPVGQVAPRDMVTVYASITKFRAPRHPQLGTVFVQVVCEVLAVHAHCKELQDLHIKMGKLMETCKGATPEIQSYVFKKFYFNPGDNSPGTSQRVPQYDTYAWTKTSLAAPKA